MVNFKVRLKSWSFWVTIIPSLLFIAQVVCDVLKVTADWGYVTETVWNAAKAIWAPLMLIGIVNDPTTEGFKDSTLALTYEHPKVSPTNVAPPADDEPPFDADPASALPADAPTVIMAPPAAKTFDENLKRLIDIANSEVGYRGKRTADKLDDANANPGGCFTKYARDLDALNWFYGKKQGWAYCTVGITWAFVQAFGTELARKLLKQPTKNNFAADVGFFADYIGTKVKPAEVQEGDIVVLGKDDHVELVVGFSGEYMVCVSFNSTDGAGSFVNRCVFSPKHQNVSRIVRPDWSVLLTEEV